MINTSPQLSFILSREPRPDMPQTSGDDINEVYLGANCVRKDRLTQNIHWRRKDLCMNELVPNAWCPV